MRGCGYQRDRADRERDADECRGAGLLAVEQPPSDGHDRGHHRGHRRDDAHLPGRERGVQQPEADHGQDPGDRATDECAAARIGARIEPDREQRDREARPGAR